MPLKGIQTTHRLACPLEEVMQLTGPHIRCKSWRARSGGESMAHIIQSEKKHKNTPI